MRGRLLTDGSRLCADLASLRLGLREHHVRDPQRVGQQGVLLTRPSGMLRRPRAGRVSVGAGIEGLLGRTRLGQLLGRGNAMPRQGRLATRLRRRSAPVLRRSSEPSWRRGGPLRPGARTRAAPPDIRLALVDIGPAPLVYRRHGPARMIRRPPPLIHRTHRPARMIRGPPPLIHRTHRPARMIRGPPPLIHRTHRPARMIRGQVCARGHRRRPVPVRWFVRFWVGLIRHRGHLQWMPGTMRASMWMPAPGDDGLVSAVTPRSAGQPGTEHSENCRRDNS
jgi:hypothetical protein